MSQNVWRPRAQRHVPARDLRSGLHCPLDLLLFHLPLHRGSFEHLHLDCHRVFQEFKTSPLHPNRWRGNKWFGNWSGVDTNLPFTVILSRQLFSISDR